MSNTSVIFEFEDKNGHYSPNDNVLTSLDEGLAQIIFNADEIIIPTKKASYGKYGKATRAKVVKTTLNLYDNPVYPTLHVRLKEIENN